MTRDERTLNSYALRNAILLAVYGIYGLILLPLVYYRIFITHIGGRMGIVILLLVGIRAISYLWIGFSGMMTPSAIRKNHQPLSILLFLFTVLNLFIGVYLSVKDGLATQHITALSLSSLLGDGLLLHAFSAEGIVPCRAQDHDRIVAVLLRRRRNLLPPDSVCEHNHGMVHDMDVAQWTEPRIVEIVCVQRYRKPMFLSTTLHTQLIEKFPD